ncbi:TonB-dependent receptor [Peristeroidobacter soli]|uniref:TonB-dependent receptor n=1 Tax=Peristeroidobacter soli TaxID=2497877 RepID=UPI00101C95D7|nr:TonB-dependent receptor [Peristeroidobacter soli]
MKKFLTGASSAMLIFAAGNEARAQAATDVAASDDSRGTVEEIVVTAQKRSESILTVPLSITAITADTLERKGVRNVEELSLTVPGMAVQATTENSPKFYSLRGIGPDGATAATVAVYVDDTPITVGNNSPDLKIFDVSRIEVLRGPQGTLFGSSAMGGAIRYVTPDPDFEVFSGRALAETSTTAHGDINYETQLSLSGPLSDNLAFRAAGFYSHDGGYIDIVDDATGAVREKDANSRESFGGRLALATRFGEAVTGTLSVIYQDSQDDAQSFMGVFRTFADVNTPLARYQRTERADTGLHDRIVLPNFKLTADLGFAELTSSTSYHDQTVEYDVDASYALASSFGLPAATRDQVSLLARRTKEFSAFVQEVRLASSGEGMFEWLVGGYYRRSKGSTDQNFHSNLLSVSNIAPTSLLAGGDIETLDSSSKGDELAGFGEVSAHLADKLTLTAGLRVSSVKGKSARSVEVFAPILGGTTTTILPPDSSEHPVTPRFSAEYQIADDHMVYAAAAKGYREGGANGPLFLANAACQPALDALGLSGGVPAYDSDTLWNYELGAKGRWFERTLTYATAVYQIDWDNIQQSINLSRPCGASPIANLGAARIQGVEGDLEFRPLGGGLTLGLNFNYFFSAELARDRITGVTNTTPPVPVVGALSGTQLPNTPELTVTLSAQYAWQLRDTWSAYVRAEGTSIDRAYRFVRTTTAPNDPSLEREGYEVVSLRTGLDTGDYEISIYANNLLDADPTIVRQANFAASRSAGGFSESTIRPRTIGLSVSRSF